MRPIMLKMSAFGPYAGETIIPMEELGSQGLYLITGDTGAGKTTIFDAICYALYGEASGANRESSMFRSKYAEVDTPTEVELVFIHCGKEYRIKRIPEYLRPAKRGDGYTKQQAEAELYMPDGQIITKTKDVTVAIEGLLGINRDQFSQIAMLAQGDFLKLLLADTKTRQEIFRELFKTGYYRELQNELDDKRKEIYIQVMDGRKSVEQFVSGIAVDEDDVLAIDVNKAKNGQMTTEDIIELIDSLIIKDREIKVKLESELGEINKELEKVNGNIGAAEASLQTERELESAKERLAVIIPEENALKEEYAKAKKELKGKDKLTAEVAEVGAEMANYDTVDKLVCDISEARKSRETEQTLLDETTLALVEKQDALDGFKKEQVEYKDVSATVEKLSAELEKIDNEIEALSELEEDYKAYLEDAEELINLQNKYGLANQAFCTAKDKYEQMDQAFRDGQAGILAMSLSDGDACPVCGSTTHPQKAKLSESVPTEADLNKAKDASEKAREAANEASNNAGKAKASIETKEKELKKKAAKLLKVTDIASLSEELIMAKSNANDKAKEVKALLVAEQNKVDRKAKLDELIPNTEEEIKGLTNKLTELRESLSAAETKIAENTKQLDTLKKMLRFESKVAAEERCIHLNQEANKLQKAYDMAEANYKSKAEEVVGLKAKIEGFIKSLENANTDSLESDKTKKAELDNKQTDIIEVSQIVTSRIETNDSIKSNIEKKSAQIAEIEKKLQWVTALSDTANGKLRGKEKIMLETYIQTTYFDRIISRANVRLMKMTSGQYELKRQGEASNSKSQSGLELGVIDHYNGSERSVKTLSGGESFMASLSLALGLSDEVQSSAGGIQIETMFVDEGFGSLDPESLNQAYSALASLTEGNRLVGIISHVSELKDKIDSQIVVTKAKSGGSYAKVVV